MSQCRIKNLKLSLLIASGERLLSQNYELPINKYATYEKLVSEMDMGKDNQERNKKILSSFYVNKHILIKTCIAF